MFSDSKLSYALSVLSVKEIEAPLGGTSHLYVTTLSEGAESSHVEKTFREIEDFSKRLAKRVPHIKFPILTCALDDIASRRATADSFMKFVTANYENVSCGLIKELLGFENQPNYVVPKKQTIPKKKTPDQPRMDNSNELFMEFQNAKKLTKQQKGRTSFFDDCDDDEEDLFGNANKPTKLNPVVEPEKRDEEETANNNFKENPKEDENLNVKKPQEDNVDSSLFGEEEEIDESIMRLDDNIDNLDHLLKPKTADQAKPAVKAKPVPAPKPIPPPKPGHLKRTPASDAELDINRYISLEEATNSEELKLFD